MPAFQHDAARPKPQKPIAPRRGPAEEPAAQQVLAPSPSPVRRPVAPPPPRPLRRRRGHELDLAAGDPAPQAAIDAYTDPGRPLSSAELDRATERLGWDFSGVRVHEGPQADAGVQSVGALAYTVGPDIVVGSPRRGNSAVLTHELMHVVQQAGIAAAPTVPIVGSAGGVLEDQARRGPSALSAIASVPTLQRETPPERILGPEELADQGWLPLIPFEGSPKAVAEGTAKFLAAQYPAIKIGGIFVLTDKLYGFLPVDLEHPKTWDLTGKGSLPPPGVLVGEAKGQERLYVKGPDDKQEFYLTPVAFRGNVQLTTSTSITRAEEEAYLRGGAAVFVRPQALAPPPGGKATGGKGVSEPKEPGQGQKKAPPPPPRPHTGSEYEGGTGQPATDPGWPAQLTGPDLQPTGGTGTYDMVLDWSMLGTQGDLLSLVTNQMSDIAYIWEWFDITEIAKKGETANAVEAKRREAVSPDKVVGPDVVLARDAERRANDLAEDAQTSLDAMTHQRPGETASEAIGRIGVEYENLTLLPVSAIVSLGGLVIDSFSVTLGAWSSEHDIPWPHKQGLYLVRCIASPVAQGEHRRAPSFAVKIVEVRPTEYIARNTLGAAEADIEELKAAIRLEQDPKRKKDLEDRLADAEVGAHGTAVAALEVAVRRKEADLATATTNRDRLDAELKALRFQLERARGRSAQFTGTSFRPRAAFASEVTGLTYPLILQLGRLSGSGGRVRWLLSDESAKEGGTYEQAADNDEDAIWKAFEDFAGGNGFGRGTLVVELPAAIPGIKQRTKVLRNKETGVELLKTRLNDLVTILTALSLFIPGLGEVAAIIGGGLAAERLYERFKKGTLDLTDPATIGDIIGVLAAAATALGTIGKLRLVKAQNSFALLGEDATAAEVAAAAEDLKQAASFAKGAAVYGKIINYGGLIWGDVSTLGTLISISDQERDGKITHSEARRMRAEALLSALQNNVLFIHGLAEAQRQEAAAGRAEETRTENQPPDKQEREQRTAGPHPDPDLTATGAVRGPDVYGKLGNTPKVKTGEPSLESGLDTAAARNRPFSKIGRTAPAVPGTPSEFEMTVKSPAGADVPVKMTVRAADKLGGLGPHGTESGPARVILKRSAAGWEAEILIRDKVYPADIAHIAGHEFNEIAKIVRDFPLADEATIQGQMEAAVFKSGGRGTPTAHDYAAAHELAGFYDEYTAARASKNIAGAKAARARVDRMLAAMGLDISDPTTAADPVALKDRLDSLRDLGLPPELDQELRPKAEALASNQRRPGGTPLTVDRVQHILYAKAVHNVTEFVDAGVSGGHLDAELVRFATENPEFHFEKVGEKPIGSATGRKYEQYLYKHGVPPPEARWGQPKFNAADWTKSTEFKTTVSDARVLLDEGASAWDRYAGKPTTGSGQVEWQSTSASGVKFSGFAAPVGGPPPGWQINTFYPDQGWF